MSLTATCSTSASASVAAITCTRSESQENTIDGDWRRICSERKGKSKGAANSVQEAELLLLRRVVQRRVLVESRQASDHLVRVSLIHEEALPFARKVHLVRVARDERVEVRVEALRVAVRAAAAGGALRAQDAAETLRLLAPAAALRGDLNKHVGVGQVEARVRHLRHEYGANQRVVLEVAQDLQSLRLRSRPVDEWLVEAQSKVAQREDVVAEHDDLVVAALVVPNQVLTGAELVRIHHAEKLEKSTLLWCAVIYK